MGERFTPSVEFLDEQAHQREEVRKLEEREAARKREQYERREYGYRLIEPVAIEESFEALSDKATD